MRPVSVFLSLGLLAAPSAAVSAAPPRIEVAFVLDTTGSMGGLLEGAKRRIWSIARRIGEGRPRPDLRIALVGYRDRGDAYLTRVHDLTDDMDAVYANLMAFEASGGGDTPEHVSAALAAAVHEVSWSRGRVLRVLYLVGDAPPHVDYQDGYDYRRHVAEAAARGIVVEAIQCGDDPETARYWRRIAGLGAGHYARIDAQGGMPVRVTPLDAELARLNQALARTVVAYGSASERADAARRVEARTAMPAPAAAEAAGYFAGGGRLVAKDLVDLPVEERRQALDRLKREGNAPAALARKTDAEALAELEARGAERERIRAQIATLEKRRQAWLDAQAAPDAFDARVVEWLKARAAGFGIRY